MSKVRVVFLGTPDFAVTALQSLLQDEHYDVVGVVTQPDRPAGRKMVLTPTPVKTLALARGIPCLTPEKINQDGILFEIQKWGAEIAVVVAFGQILSQKFLDSFKFGAVNIHGSILPKWRGAAPIQRSIEAGDTETGVTLQKIVKELDAGDILGLRRIVLDEKIGARELYEKLAVMGADLLHVELMDYLRGNLAPVPQDHTQVTIAKKINKLEAELDWKLPALVLHNRVRGFDAGPGTWVPFQGKKLKIHKTECLRITATAQPGCIEKISESEGLIDIATGSQVLRLLEVQPESRNRQPVVDFLKSVHSLNLKKGDRFV